MFEKHEIWARDQECVLRYLVFRDIETNLYHLQQVDCLYDRGSKEATEMSAIQLSLAINVFLEEPPSARTRGFVTIREAVASWSET